MVENGVTQAGLSGHFPASQGSHKASLSPVFSKHLRFLSPIHCTDSETTKCELIYPESIMKFQTRKEIARPTLRSTSPVGSFPMKDHVSKISATAAAVPPLTVFTEDTPTDLDHLQKMLNRKLSIVHQSKGSSKLKLLLIQLWKTHYTCFYTQHFLFLVKTLLETYIISWKGPGSFSTRVFVKLILNMLFKNLLGM